MHRLAAGMPPRRQCLAHRLKSGKKRLPVGFWGDEEIGLLYSAKWFIIRAAAGFRGRRKKFCLFRKFLVSLFEKAVQREYNGKNALPASPAPLKEGGREPPPAGGTGRRSPLKAGEGSGSSFSAVRLDKRAEGREVM